MSLKNALKKVALCVALLLPLSAGAADKDPVESLRKERPVQMSMGLGFGTGMLGMTWIPKPNFRVGYQVKDHVNLYVEAEPLWLENRFLTGAQVQMRQSH